MSPLESLPHNEFEGGDSGSNEIREIAPADPFYGERRVPLVRPSLMMGPLSIAL